MPKYEHILRAVSQTPWAILEDKLADIKAFLARAAGNSSLSKEEIRAQFQQAPQRERIMVGSVEVIPVQGVISQKVNMMTEFSGGTSTELLTQEIQRAVDDKKVSTILLDIDSPGGSVYGVPELADFMMQARQKKRIVALANPVAASAAYWIAAAASEIVVAPSGQVGSIGVICVHDDVSEAQKMSGVRTTVLRAGKFKAEGNPFEPLDEEGRAAIQASLEAYYDMFVRAVASGRGADPRSVRSGFGQGRMVMAAEAKAQGMADRIGTLDATLGRLLLRSARQSGDKSAISTIRDFEAFLRDEGGFSNTEAKKIASAGYEEDRLPPRDGEGAPVPETVPGVVDQEGLAALRAFTDQVTR